MTQLGAFKLHVLTDGAFYLDGGQVFGIVPKKMWEQRHPPDEDNLVALYLRPLLVDTGERRVLIEAGIGDRAGAKFEKIYKIQREPRQLVQSLQGAGYQPEDVTDVIFTHLHFDHCGGATYENEEGVPQLTFPNAVYYASPSEFDSARERHPRTRGSYREDFIEPIVASGKLRSIREEGVLLPGFTALQTPGHTAHHYSVLVQSEGQHLAFWGDLMPMTVHLHPAWAAALDTHPMEAAESKRNLLQRARDEGWHYHYFYHEMKPLLSAAEVEVLLNPGK
jgi:glyoxylase-like metal-dependent hydrolase (beta-lactamase superfamily II)